MVAEDLDQLVLLQEQEGDHSEVGEVVVPVEAEDTAVEVAAAVHQPVEVLKFQ